MWEVLRQHDGDPQVVVGVCDASAELLVINSDNCALANLMYHAMFVNKITI